MSDQNNDIFSNELQVDAITKHHLKGIVTWALVIVATTVLGYVVTIVDTIISPVVEIGTQQEGFNASMAFGQKSLTSAIIQTIIGLVINFFLYRFAILINEGVKTSDNDKLTLGFRNVKIYFAILTIVSILAMLIVLIAFAAFV